MRSMRRASLGAVFFVTATVIAPPLSAQTYPDHPIKLIVPSASGGPTDIPARMTAGFIPKLGQPGVVENRPDPELHQRYAEALYAETGFDLRGREFPHFYAANLLGASSVEVGGGHLDITIWAPGKPERVVRKH